MERGPILVGDVGGTNVRFALARQTLDGLSVEHFEKYPGDEFPDFYSVLQGYLQAVNVQVKGACFALAGPVANNAVTLTNRAWTIEGSRLQREFALDRAILVNDFVGMARAVPEVDPAKLQPIYRGEGMKGAPKIVAGPGTGFGVATLVPRPNDQWLVFNGEGGHMAFAPRSKWEIELVRVLLRDHGYVSNELVAAGVGLNALIKATCEVMGQPFEPLAPHEVQMRAEKGDKFCERIMSVRANTVMSAVGSLVLANGARDGVVLAGGVTEHLVPYFDTEAARAHFYDRGIQTGYMEHCPVSLLREEEAPLIGAAAYYFQEWDE